jgi:hypothetical protein
LVTRKPFAGDRRTLATLGGDPRRRRIEVVFSLARPAIVSLAVVESGQGVASERLLSSGQAGIAARMLRLGAGGHTLGWEPAPAQPARTYIVRVSAREGPRLAEQSAVVRLMGIDAGFLTPSVRPGATAALVIRTDARALRLQLLRCGPETAPTYANDLMNGVPIGPPRELDWRARRNGRRRCTCRWRQACPAASTASASTPTTAASVSHHSSSRRRCRRSESR